MIIIEIPTQEGEVRLAPAGDGVIAVAIGHRPADDERQHLGERMRNPLGLARVVDRREMRKQRLQAGLFFKQREGKAHGELTNPLIFLVTQFCRGVWRNGSLTNRFCGWQGDASDSTAA